MQRSVGLMTTAMTVIALASAPVGAQQHSSVESLLKEFHGAQSFWQQRDVAKRLVKAGDPRSWCAAPRSPEPLLVDAREHASGNSLQAEVFRGTNKLPILDAKTVEIVKDENICRRAAEAYRAWHLRELPTWRLKPVIVARVGPVFMVDDQRSRRGRDVSWAVLVYDSNFNERPGHFGAGY